LARLAREAEMPNPRIGLETGDDRGRVVRAIVVNDDYIPRQFGGRALLG
jgi:hypothetical protein